MDSNDRIRLERRDRQSSPNRHNLSKDLQPSPGSASKIIEKSLHDLDDLIQQRRMELMALRESNKLRLQDQNGMMGRSRSAERPTSMSSVVQYSRSPIDKHMPSTIRANMSGRFESLHADEGVRYGSFSPKAKFDITSCG